MNKFLLALAVGSVAFAAGCSNLERSRDLANPNVSAAVTAVQVCSICHGLDGNSVSPNFPRLAGQQPAYLIAQLENFRSHHRADPPGFEYMWGISGKLSDDQIKGLAEYFSKQVALPNAQVTAQQMAAGKEIFDKGLPAKETAPCFVCHGPKAEGMVTFPRLANQHQDYLVKQLHVFQETEGRPGTPMKEITHSLTNEEMEAVAGFLQAFPSDK
ncbi:MAG: c-type cytochrome [Proteobacteria bacterium]|nr:c-type cytochrome [Pseudomonadota bacterium]